MALTNPASSLFPLNDYEYDGVTTYCYWLKQPMNASSFSYSDTKLEGKGKQCPLEIAISQASPGPLYPKSSVYYKFTATLNLDSNIFGVTELDAVTTDPVTKNRAQIAHANLHACSRQSVCDVFRRGTNNRISYQQTSNFTDGNATFIQQVDFPVAGEYNVFVHIILPVKNETEETYQFIAFTRTTISSSEAGQATTSSNSEVSSIVTAGVVVGLSLLLLVIVIGVLIFRRKKADLPTTPGHDHYEASRTTTSSRPQLDASMASERTTVSSFDESRDDCEKKYRITSDSKVPTENTKTTGRERA